MDCNNYVMMKFEVLKLNAKLIIPLSVIKISTTLNSINKSHKIDIKTWPYFCWNSFMAESALVKNALKVNIILKPISCFFAEGLSC